MSVIFVTLKYYLLIAYLRITGKIKRIWNNLWFNKKKREDLEAYIDDLSDIDVIEQSDYNSLFLVKNSTSHIYMPRPILLKIIRSLPEGYVFPNPEAIQLLKEEVEKFNEQKIDQEVLNQILQNLPPNYSLLNPFVFKDHSNQPIKVNLSSKSDKTVQNQIMNNLPFDYKFH
nr:hypothetical protein [Lysinibacillus timonensis]